MELKLGHLVTEIRRRSILRYEEETCPEKRRKENGKKKKEIRS